MPFIWNINISNHDFIKPSLHRILIPFIKKRKKKKKKKLRAQFPPSRDNKMFTLINR